VHTGGGERLPELAYTPLHLGRRDLIERGVSEQYDKKANPGLRRSLRTVDAGGPCEVVLRGLCERPPCPLPALFRADAVAGFAAFNGGAPARLGVRPCASVVVRAGGLGLERPYALLVLCAAWPRHTSAARVAAPVARSMCRVNCRSRRETTEPGSVPRGRHRNVAWAFRRSFPCFLPP